MYSAHGHIIITPEASISLCLSSLIASQKPTESISVTDTHAHTHTQWNMGKFTIHDRSRGHLFRRTADGWNKFGAH